MRVTEALTEVEADRQRIRLPGKTAPRPLIEAKAEWAEASMSAGDPAAGEEP